MTARRVVTGQTIDGKSVFVSDQQVSPITVRAFPGTEFYRLWGSDEIVRLPIPGEVPSAPNYVPPVSGFRFVLVKLGRTRKRGRNISICAMQSTRSVRSFPDLLKSW